MSLTSDGALTIKWVPMSYHGTEFLRVNSFLDTYLKYTSIPPQLADNQRTNSSAIQKGADSNSYLVETNPFLQRKHPTF